MEEDENVPPFGATSSSVFEKMTKPEVRKTTSGGVQAKNMRQKLANLRKNKNSRTGSDKSGTGSNSIMNSFGKRKLSTEENELPVQKKITSGPNPISQSALENMDQFAADSDE